MSDEDEELVPVEVHERDWQWRPSGDDSSFAPPFGTIRKCRRCGCLVAGGPTACARCAEAMIDPALHMEALIETARRATCKKDSRAAALIGREGIISIASNGPPAGFPCRGNADCMEVCGKVAVHAEMRAMLIATAPIAGAEMVHLRVDAAGRPMSSGIPRCFQCSKHMLDAGVAALWLLREHGWERWPMDCAHAVSLDHAMLLPNHGRNLP